MSSTTKPQREIQVFTHTRMTVLITEDVNTVAVCISDGNRHHVNLMLPAGTYDVSVITADAAKDFPYSEQLYSYEPYGIRVTEHSSGDETVFVFDEIKPIADSRVPRGVVMRQHGKERDDDSH